MSMLRGIVALVMVGTGALDAHRAPPAPAPRVSVLALALIDLWKLPDDLTDELTVRGAAWMADRIDKAIGLSMSPGAPGTRRCPA